MRRSLDWLLIGSWLCVLVGNALIFLGVVLGVLWLVDRLAS